MNEGIGIEALDAALTSGADASRRSRSHAGSTASTCLAAWAVVVLSGCGPASEGDADFAWEESTAQDARVQYSTGSGRGRYTLFEADPVRPIAVLERSGVVAVTNTVDNYLEFFQPTRRSARHCGAVQVGLQPVAVAVVRESRSAAELWVVNQLSDSVSVVDLDLEDCSAGVVRTLDVGDEPRDIVVTRDSGRARVFVATAHRGQHHPLPGARLGTDLITPAGEKDHAGLADVLVFDPDAPAEPPRVVNLFSDKPRALAVGDGVIYAASYFSGNRTTVIPAETVTLRGLESLGPLLARDAEGAPVEQGDELVLAPGVAGQAAIEGGLPAVAGRGRCLADPRDEDEDFNLLRLCAETDEQSRVQRVHVQRDGVLNPSCQCTSGDGTLQPRTGVIVQFFADPATCGSAWTTFPDGSQGCWLDSAPGGVRTPARAADRQAIPMAWNDQVKFSLPDQDVFAIDADALGVTRAYSGVGTILFGMAVQPETGHVFVTNTDAQNLTRFEGHGQSSSTSVIGHLHESRVTVIDPVRTDAAVTPVHLNTHIDYARCCEKDADENAKSFAFPTSGVFSADGDLFFFSALGSDKVGIVRAGLLEADFDHDAARAAGELREIFLGDDAAAPSGPVGLALDGRRERLYVKTHFTNELVVVDARRERITGRVRLSSPEPASVTRGRSILYNARLTSSHGDSACASCHVFGDFDGLAWDLGDPEGATVTNPGPFALPDFDIADFRSNKGPMTTQTLRGLANHGPLHWRGDRTRRFQDSPGEQPDFGSFDESNSFGEFDVAIAGLNGNDEPLDPEVFARFTAFALQLTLPPNPIRHLDDTLTSDQAAARALYFGCASMTDEQFEARTCVGLDGSLVEIEPASAQCLCAQNPIVDGLRLSGEVRGFAELLQTVLASGDLRSRLEALAGDTTGLSPEAEAEVTVAAAAFAEAAAELLLADLAPGEKSLLSASLEAALSKLSGSLLTVLGASQRNQTDVAQRIAEALFEAIPVAALPPEVTRDVNGAVAIFQTIAEVSGLNELARSDELARGTSAFRNVLNDCDVDAERSCNLRVTDTALTCHGCHTLDPRGNAEFDVEKPGFFGTSGVYSFEGESQVFKIPHLRNAYQKTGMFGAAPNPFFLPESVLGPRSGGFFSRETQYTGPQVRGTGFFHDGVTDTLHRFHGATAFVRSGDNEDGLDAFLPREDQRAACVQRFRQASADLFDLADAELRPFLTLCVSSGPLPESCFTQPVAEACRAALTEVGAALGVEISPEAFSEGVLPLCFQLGSMTEQGAAGGVCYPTGLRERSQMESFMLAFDSNLKPMVGQQLTLAAGLADPRLAELLAAGARGDCDLAVRQRGQGYLVTAPNPASPGRSTLESRGGRRVTLDALASRRGALTLTCHPAAIELAEARRAAFAGSERPH